MLALILGIIVVLIGGLAAADQLALDGKWRKRLLGQEATPSPSTVPSPTPDEPSPSPTSPSPAPTLSPAPTTSPAPGTPDDAIRAHLAAFQLSYAGDCDTASIEEDVGSYCSTLWEEREGHRVYLVGPTFSEPDLWLLLAPGAGGEWEIVDSAVARPKDVGPPWG